MTYNQINEKLKELKKEEPTAYLMLSVAMAVNDNIDTRNFTEAEYEEACKAIEWYWLLGEMDVEIGDFCYCIQEQLSSGDYTEISIECMSKAHGQAMEMKSL